MSKKQKYIKCLACGTKIKKKDNILGLLPRQQIVELYKNHTEFYTNNDIKFIWKKNKWNDSKVGCYGSIVHKNCWDYLKNNLGINITFEDIYKHIDNYNQFNKIKYSESLEDTWKNFILYKYSILKRKQSCDRFQKMRLIEANNNKFKAIRTSGFFK